MPLDSSGLFTYDFWSYSWSYYWPHFHVKTKWMDSSMHYFADDIEFEMKASCLQIKQSANYAIIHINAHFGDLFALKVKRMCAVHCTDCVQIVKIRKCFSCQIWFLFRLLLQIHYIPPRCQCDIYRNEQFYVCVTWKWQSSRVSSIIYRAFKNHVHLFWQRTIYFLDYAPTKCKALHKIIPLSTDSHH